MVCRTAQSALQKPGFSEKPGFLAAAGRGRYGSHPCSLSLALIAMPPYAADRRELSGVRPDDPGGAGPTLRDPDGYGVPRRTSVIGTSFLRLPLIPTASPRPGANLPRQAIAKFWHRLFELTPHTLVTPAILAVNAVVFVLMAIDGGAILDADRRDLDRLGRNYGPLTLDGQWWRLLTCTFVHVGLIHIGLNMWVLWDIGQLIERLAGNVGFLLLYLLSGLFGSLASLYWNPACSAPALRRGVRGVRRPDGLCAASRRLDPQEHPGPSARQRVFLPLLQLDFRPVDQRHRHGRPSRRFCGRFRVRPRSEPAAGSRDAG